MTRRALLPLAALLIACATDEPGDSDRTEASAASGERIEIGAAESGAEEDLAKPWNIEGAKADWADAIAGLSKDGLTREATQKGLKSMRKQISAVVRARIAAMSKLTELQQRVAGLEAVEERSGDDEARLNTLREDGRRARSELESIFEHVIEMKSSMVVLRLRIGGVAAAELDQLIYGLDAEQAHHVIPKVARNDP